MKSATAAPTKNGVAGGVATPVVEPWTGSEEPQAASMPVSIAVAAESNDRAQTDRRIILD
ncbi:MAG: hypothetical protein IRZ06_12480 [Nevskia sp.]|nr:hypothetical protein [Nevskia sp.]